MSLNIKTNKNIYDLNFYGIKILQADFCSKLVKDLTNKSIITINNKEIKEENIIILDELTKINSFLTLSKNSKIVEKILNSIGDNSLVNQEIISKVEKEVNNFFEIIESNDGDRNKLINIIFSIIDLGFLNHKNFIYLLKEIFIDKNYLFIINDISWIRISDLEPFLNNFHFLIITNDFRKIIRNKNDLELIVILSEDNYLEIEDKDKIIAYIEKEMNISLNNNESFNKIINDKFSKNSIYILNLIKQLAQKK
ncbi:MAG: hypothetical protein ACRCRZ_01100 [Metamycoplasmataceae bacterium]